MCVKSRRFWIPAGSLVVIAIAAIFICFLLMIFVLVQGTWPKVKCLDKPCNASVIIFPDDLLNEHCPHCIGTYDVYNITNGKTSFRKINYSQTHSVYYLYNFGNDWGVSKKLGDNYEYVVNLKCDCSNPSQCGKGWQVANGRKFKKDHDFLIKCNVCDKDNPCKNNGICSVEPGSDPFNCECKEGYFGETCEGKYCTSDKDCTDTESSPYCVNGECNKKVCKFYNGDISPKGHYQTVSDVWSQQECADTVRTKYANATGAMWFNVSELICETRYGNKFDYGSFDGHSSCLFTNPCSQNSDCQGTHYKCVDGFCHQDDTWKNWLYGGLLIALIICCCSGLLYFYWRYQRSI